MPANEARTQQGARALLTSASFVRRPSIPLFPLLLFIAISLAPAILPETATAAPAVRLRALYYGMGKDMVGTGRQATPDGKEDARFRVVLDTEGDPRMVKEILLQSSDSFGIPTGIQAWDTRPGSFWILGVFRAGERLNPTDLGISDRVRGRIEYDLYANPGSFLPGDHFLVTVRFAEGDEVSAHVEIPGAPPPSARPPGGPGFPPGGSGRTSGSIWRPTTVPFDPECRKDCREVKHVRDAHGADMTFLYNPKVDDALAQWGDCVHSILTCLVKPETDLPGCVGKSACPEQCRARFLDRIGGERDPRRILGILESVFIVRGADCGPGDGQEGK